MSDHTFWQLNFMAYAYFIGACAVAFVVFGNTRKPFASLFIGAFWILTLPLAYAVVFKDWVTSWKQ